MNDDLRRLFKQSSTVILITGRRGKGKTNLALRLMEDALEKLWVSKVATNIKTIDDRITQTCYMNTLEAWLQGTKGRKGIVLDELGKHLNRMRFMTELSKLILDLIQLVRHYDAYFIGCGVTEDLINKHFLNLDLLDCQIKKLYWKTATVKNFVTYQKYTMRGIPATTIRYDSKDIASFGKTDPKTPSEAFDSLPKCCKCAMLYLKYRSLRKVGDKMGCSFQNVALLLDTHLKHTGFHNI